MNTCKKCGLAFYGAIGENYCGTTCRGNADTRAEDKGTTLKSATLKDGEKRIGFWRRIFGGKKQG